MSLTLRQSQELVSDTSLWPIVNKIVLLSQLKASLTHQSNDRESYERIRHLSLSLHPLTASASALALQLVCLLLSVCAYVSTHSAHCIRVCVCVDIHHVGQLGLQQVIKLKRQALHPVAHIVVGTVQPPTARRRR